MMLLMVFMMLPAAQVSAERINEVFDTLPKLNEGELSSGRESGTMEFKNVSFTYKDGQEEALHDISFRVEQGQTLRCQWHTALPILHLQDYRSASKPQPIP